MEVTALRLVLTLRICHPKWTLWLSFILSWWGDLLQMFGFPTTAAPSTVKWEAVEPPGKNVDVSNYPAPQPLYYLQYRRVHLWVCFFSVFYLGSSNVGDTLPTGQLSTVPWRRADVKYTNNEAYFDVIEEIDAILDKSGTNKCIHGS